MSEHQNERIVQRLSPTSAQVGAELGSPERVGDALREAQHQAVMQQTHANTVVQADEVGIPQL